MRRVNNKPFVMAIVAISAAIQDSRMPWVRSSLRTVSEGCAPRSSQSRTRSSLSVIVEGLVWAL